MVVAKFAGGPAGMVLGAVSRIIHYGFRDLFDEIAWWLALGHRAVCSRGGRIARGRIPERLGRRCGVDAADAGPEHPTLHLRIVFDATSGGASSQGAEPRGRACVSARRPGHQYWQRRRAAQGFGRRGPSRCISLPSPS